MKSLEEEIKDILLNEVGIKYSHEYDKKLMKHKKKVYKKDALW